MYLFMFQVMIGANSKAVKRVLDAVAKAAPGLSFMGFSAEGPGPSGKLLVFNVVAGSAQEVTRVNCTTRKNDEIPARGETQYSVLFA